MQSLKLILYLTFKYNGLLSYVFVEALLLPQTVLNFPKCIRCAGVVDELS